MLISVLPSSRRCALLLLMTCTFSCVGQGGAISQWHRIRGTWVLESIYQTSNVEGPSGWEQKELVGTTIVLNAHSMRACGQSARVTSVREQQVSPDEFLFGTRVRFSEVGITAPAITEVILNNREAGTCYGAFPLPGQDIHIKNNDELLIDFEGVFYRALRKRAADHGLGSTAL